MRIWLYVAILLILVSFKFNPAFRSKPSPPKDNVIVLTGLDLAPVLIPRLVTGYREVHPGRDVRILGGGTRQALEALVNSQADAAFLNRLPTAEEKKAMAVVVDSIWSYPIALGGIAVLSARAGGMDSLTTEELRTWMRGGEVPSRAEPTHFYVPDPNLGLWGSLADQLGLPEDRAPRMIYLADEAAILQAVTAEPTSLGFASTLSLIHDLDETGARMVRVRGDTTSVAALPEPGDIATGEYPLYHYLYLSCRPDVDIETAGFITFMYNGRGQRLVEREGYLPARQVARLIQLVQKPLS